MGVWMLNVHSLGGKEMLRAACEVVEKASIKPLLVGVTVLTSLNDKSLKEVGLGLNTEDQVLLLAELCQTEGLNGVVCSANELSVLRKHLEEDFLFAEPCAGDGTLIEHLERKGVCMWASDIEPQKDGIIQRDYNLVGHNALLESEYIITNPPWDRNILHPMIEYFSMWRPTWLLFDADWMHTLSLIHI